MGKNLLETAKEKTVIFDGAMGTELMAAGLPPGTAPVLWNLENPSVVMDIQRRYFEAGSDVVHTNTFGGNSLRLSDQGLGEKMESLNVEAAKIAKEVCPEGKFVAGDIGPTGKLLKPLGKFTPEEVEEAFYNQARALIKGGVDFISIETMISLEEAVLAVKGAKTALEGIFVIASMTFSKTKRGFFTMMGDGVGKSLSSLEDAGAGAVGANCSLGSEEMIELTKEMRGATKNPILMQPNAGKPVVRDGVTYYEQGASEFARDIRKIREVGADMIGGCCGTTPEFISELRKVLS